MASHLASIYGTEKDKVNCSFFFKIGACRHGDSCSRKHTRPNYSCTMLLPNLYINPAHDPTCTLTSEQQQQHFNLFYEDLFVELGKYGEIELLNICDNIADHLIGNVYVRYADELSAGKAVKDLNNRWYAGRPLFAELSPVTDFREACCRQYDMGECNRGGFCNFMHLRKPDSKLEKELFHAQRVSMRLKEEEENSKKEKGKEKSRSRSPIRRRSKSRDRRSRSRDRDRERRRRSRDRHDRR
ncbi:RNA-binding domain-containing protein [Rozella allomycis CSF55]|uniref:Nucleotide-binding, alpha-beta plait domain-containing protein n=1 Tax=Rozella allomycis (strain CSF55) TaxID=988480 RepID=A0A075AZW1_ROZAC|nr:Nucleotide-binding, alpha-beta plait domain-containing protein [Rozella allomycis CSF55]RKP20369.1 RNA-binding domain-containing protein [Rozella allomycis CSF55]|eukprot:EPZ35644.1 Nucleotide-binding, alpha-beta plait domain-containing protein [Rozella allomycis CSF55]